MERLPMSIDQENSETRSLEKSSGKLPGTHSRRGTILVCVLMGLYSTVFITICAIKYYYFLYNDQDLATYSQAAHQFLRGNMHSSVLGMHHLGNHMSLLMYLISPVKAIASSQLTLQVIKTLVLAL